MSIVPNKSSITTCSVDQSMISIKSEGNRMTNHITNITDKFEKKCNHRNNKSIFKRLAIGAICCVFISCCFTLSIESSRLIYLMAYLSNNATVYIVEPPAFTTYFATLLLLFFLPIHCYMIIIKKDEKKINFVEILRKNIWIFPREYFHWIRTVAVFIGIVVLWNIMVYCFVRAAQKINGLNMAVIFCLNSSLSYLLCWVILHKKFIATRIIAFILGSSGTIINIYSTMNVMWFKVILTTSAAAFSVIGVILKYLQFSNSSTDNFIIYGITGLINTAVLWPVFLSLSVFTSTEQIIWAHFSWGFLLGASFGIIGMIITLEIAGRYTTRFTRSLHFLLAVPLSYFVETFWIKSHNQVTTAPKSIKTMEIVSYVLMSLSVIINSIPHQFITHVQHRIFPQKVTRQTTGRRISLAARSQLMGNGNSNLHSSFNQSHFKDLNNFIEMKTNQKS